METPEIAVTKTPEEMLAYFRSMPSKKRVNPYWDYDGKQIVAKMDEGKSFNIAQSVVALNKVREFFRRFYESFQTEAQVLCVTPEDADKLNRIGIPMLGNGTASVGPYEVKIAVLPQDNHMGTSVIGESFWQERIINAGITPIARIHSHHILDPYQSSTDYSTLNSGTLEMVIGRIFNDELNVCYWLDVPGTDIKAQTFVARQKVPDTWALRTSPDTFEVIPHVFHTVNEPKAQPFPLGKEKTCRTQA